MSHEPRATSRHVYFLQNYKLSRVTLGTRMDDSGLTGSPLSQTRKRPKVRDESWEEASPEAGRSGSYSLWTGLSLLFFSPDREPVHRLRELRRQSVPSLRGGGWGDKLGVWCVRFNEKSDKQHENRSIYTKLRNICTTSSPANPQMRWNLNAQVPRAQGALARAGSQWE